MNEGKYEWMNEQKMNEKMLEWMNKWMNEWMNERKNKWMNEWMHEWMNEWLNEGMKEWMNERMNEWLNEGMNEWINACMHEWMNEWLNEWMNEWMSNVVGLFVSCGGTRPWNLSQSLFNSPLKKCIGFHEYTNQYAKGGLHFSHVILPDHYHIDSPHLSRHVACIILIHIVSWAKQISQAKRM